MGPDHLKRWRTSTDGFMEHNEATVVCAPKKHRRLVLFPVPLQGHLNPMFQLATILYSEGFSISIIHTKFNSIDHTKYPHFNFLLISDGLPDDEIPSSDVVLLLKRLNINCADPFRECLVDLLKENEEEPVACLITDTSWYFTEAVADGLKVPRIAFRTTSVSSFLAFDAVPLFCRKGYLPKTDCRFEEAEVTEFPPLKVKDLPTFKTVDPENVCELITRIIKITKESSGLIFNSFKELEEEELTRTAKEFNLKTFAIGPLHKYFPSSSTPSSLLVQDQNAICWLEKQPPKSVLYISFGSLAMMDEKDLCEVAWGLANSMQRFLWVIRPGSVHNSNYSQLENLPNGFLEAVGERGCIVKWAPQEEVLAHFAIGCFWTHCGWNSTLESICEGVPMICSPFFGDQMVNARYVNDVWKVGVLLEEGLKREEIKGVIRKLMVDQEGEEIRERVTSLKKKSQLCVKHGGSSYQSLMSFIDYILSL